MNPLLAAILWNTAVAGVLALLVAAVGRFVERPAVRHVLWLLVLVKLVTPPLVQVPAIPDVFGSGAPVETLPAAPLMLPVGELASLEAAETPVPWSTVALAVMLAGALVVGLVGTLRIVRFGRALRWASPAPVAVARRTEVLAAWCGLRRSPSVRVVDAPVPPMVWLGLRGALIVLPAPLLDRLTADERDAVVLHELAHLRRLDPWIRPLEWLVAAVCWWNPLVPWCRRRLRMEEERSCDAEVMRRLPGRARSYAEGLLKTLEFLNEAGRPVPAWTTGMATTRKIEERLTMILKSERPRRLSGWQRLALAAVALAVLILVPAFRPVDAEPVAGEPSQRDEALERMTELEARQAALEAEIRALQESRTRVEQEEARLREVRELKTQLDRARTAGDRQAAAELRRALEDHGLARRKIVGDDRDLLLEREKHAAETELHRALELQRERELATREAAEMAYRRALELERHEMSAEHIRQRMVELERELDRLARLLAEKEGDGQSR